MLKGKLNKSIILCTSGAVLETLPGGSSSNHGDHPVPSFAAAGTNTFSLEKYLQVQGKLINYSGQDISYKAHIQSVQDLLGWGSGGLLPQKIFELLHALRSILV